MAAVTSRRVAAVAAMAADRATAEVVGALDDRGVKCLLLKGPGIADLLYDSRATRTYADVDLLVSAADRKRAEEVLTELGFNSEREGLTRAQVASLIAEVEMSTHAVPWRRGPVEVDLHRSFPGIAAPDATTWAALWGGRVPIEVCRATVQVPSTAARALIVALHAAWHGHQAHGSVRELALAVNLLPDEVWREAADLAEVLAATPALSAGLALAPGGNELVRRLELSASVTVATTLRARSLPPTALGFERLAATSGAMAKLRMVAREIVPAPVCLRHGSKLARRGRLGLALAYLWRPFWLIGHSGSGFAEWRRARRAAKGVQA